MPFIHPADPLLAISALGFIAISALANLVAALLGTRHLERRQARRKAAA